MNSRRTILSLAALLVALPSVAPIADAQTVSAKAGARVNPRTVLSERAALAAPENEQSMRDLADAVLSFPRLYLQMAPEVEAFVKNRLVRAEIRHRQGYQPGVLETDIVTLFDEFVEEFHLPPYARTSISQLHILRMRLALLEPQFMGPGLARQGSVVGDSINPEMSPLQGLHLVQTLVDQKLLNPEFQVLPEEWDKSIEKSRFADSQCSTSDESASLGSGQNASPQIIAQPNPRLRELYSALKTNSSSLSSTEALGLLERACVALRIQLLSGKGKPLAKRALPFVSKIQTL
jgi:hypothetical protein